MTSLTLRLVTLALLSLSAVSATPSSPSSVDFLSLPTLNLFGAIVEDRPPPVPSPSSSTNPKDTVYSHSSNPPNVAWDPLGFAGQASGAFQDVASKRSNGKSRVEEWTASPVGEGSTAGELGEGTAEGDEEADELLEDEDEDGSEDGGDVGDDSWYKRAKRSVGTRSPSRRTVRSWKSRQ